MTPARLGLAGMPRLPEAPEDAPLISLLRQRRSTKVFTAGRLPLDAIGELLWAATGSTGDGRRTVGSAHALYPVTTTLVAGSVSGLPAGAYRYRPEAHDLEPVGPGDHRAALAGITIDASWLTDCPAVLLLSADLDRANEHFADQGAHRGEQFALVETGAIAQNVQLWAASHGLGAVFIGGLRELDSALAPPHHQVLGLLPVGRPAENSGPTAVG